MRQISREISYLLSPISCLLAFKFAIRNSQFEIFSLCPLPYLTFIHSNLATPGPGLLHWVGISEVK
jgi:hypothetical protein